MSRAEDAPDPVPIGLAALAAKWSSAGYSTWFRIGLDSWFHPATTPGMRAVAFRPLVLNPDRDPVAPIVDAVEAVPGGREGLRDAVSEALAIWMGDSSHSGEMLEALLRFVQCLPSARSVPGLRRLMFEGHLANQPYKELLVLQVLETAMKLVALPEGEAFLHEIRQTAWQPSFAATWLEGMARAGKIDWFEGLRELRGDLELLDPTGESLRPVLRRMATRAERPAAVFEQLQSPDEIDDWLERILFDGDRPAIPVVKAAFVDTKNATIPAIAVGEEVFPLYGDPEKPTGLDQLYQIVTRRLAAAEEPPTPARSRPRPKRGEQHEEILSILAADDKFFAATRH